MRKLFATAALATATLAAISFTTKTADAGLTHYTLCWTASWGGSQCVHLPDNYHLHGVHKPHSPGGTTNFTLTRHRIHHLDRYVNTDGMHPAQRATIYAPDRGYRHHRRHHHHRRHY